MDGNLPLLSGMALAAGIAFSEPPRSILQNLQNDPAELAILKLYSTKMKSYCSFNKKESFLPRREEISADGNGLCEGFNSVLRELQFANFNPKTQAPRNLPEAESNLRN